MPGASTRLGRPRRATGSIASPLQVNGRRTSKRFGRFARLEIWSFYAAAALPASLPTGAEVVHVSIQIRQQPDPNTPGRLEKEVKSLRLISLRDNRIYEPAPLCQLLVRCLQNSDWPFFFLQGRWSCCQFYCDRWRGRSSVVRLRAKTKIKDTKIWSICFSTTNWTISSIRDDCSWSGMDSRARLCLTFCRPVLMQVGAWGICFFFCCLLPLRQFSSYGHGCMNRELRKKNPPIPT